MLFLPIHKHCIFPNPFRVTVLCICSALVKLPVFSGEYTSLPLKKGMATHSSILAWRIPWTEEPGRLQSMGSQSVRHNWTTNTHTHTHTHTPIYTPMSNIWESQFLHILINTFSFWLFWWVCSGGVAFWFCISLMTVLSPSVMSDSLWPHGPVAQGSSVHGYSPGKNTGVGCNTLLQGIFPTQGSQVSRIAGRFFTIWATREALLDD